MTHQVTMYEAVTPVPEMWECTKTCRRFGEKVDHPSFWHEGEGRCLLPTDKDIETPVFDNRCYVYCKLYERKEENDDQ